MYIQYNKIFTHSFILLSIYKRLKFTVFLTDPKQMKGRKGGGGGGGGGMERETHTQRQRERERQRQRQRDRQRQRQTDRQTETERQTDRDRDRQTETETDRQTDWGGGGGEEEREREGGIMIYSPLYVARSLLCLLIWKRAARVLMKSSRFLCSRSLELRSSTGLRCCSSSSPSWMG